MGFDSSSNELEPLQFEPCRKYEYAFFLFNAGPLERAMRMGLTIDGELIPYHLVLPSETCILTPQSGVITGMRDYPDGEYFTPIT